MTIKHLVIPGGGPSGIQSISALQHLEKNGFWKIENIETIYSTSAGSIISTLLCLKFDWETINDYIIKRPWHEAFNVDIDQFFDAYKKKGIFDSRITEIFYKPFFDAKDLSLETTMREFYEFSKIEIHLFTLEINGFELVDLSYLTHPDLPILKAVQMSTAIPILIAPVCIGNKCYADGGVVCNYPLNQCISQNNCLDEILGIINLDSDINKNSEIKEESSIIEYTIIFMSQLVNNLKLYVKPQDIPYQLSFTFEKMNLKNIQKTLSSKEKRLELFDSGIRAAREFLERINTPTN
jgi:predicted acylesterase/phospholipase RssA